MSQLLNFSIIIAQLLNGSMAQLFFDSNFAEKLSH